MKDISRRQFSRHVATGAAAVIGTSAFYFTSSTTRLAADQHSLTSSARAGLLAEALMGRMSVPPSNTRRYLIQSLIGRLVDGGIWERLDGFYMFAAHDIQAARLNWVGCMQDATSVNAPVFIADTGFVGDGATAFVDTNTLATSLEQFRTTDATMGVYTRTVAFTDAGLDLGVSGSYLNTCAANGAVSLRANYDSEAPISAESTGEPGLFAWSRDDAEVHIFRGGAKVSSTVVPSGAVSDSTITILKVDASYSVRQVSTAFIGGNLSENQHLAMNDALTAYFNALRS